MNLFSKKQNDTALFDTDVLLQKINELRPWWHKIDLGNGIVTPGGDYEWVWDPIRRLMDSVDYSGKNVLDLGSWDGLWAFEAEKRGASVVVATDSRLKGLNNFLLAREALNFKVIPLYGVPVYNIEDRLKLSGMPKYFDIIQHFGLFYHLRDPLLSLAQSRRVLADEGIFLIETAYIDDDEKSYMAFSGNDIPFHFYGYSDTWAPTKKCLREVLVSSFLEPINEENWQYAIHPDVNQEVEVGRIALMARPLPKSAGHHADVAMVFGSQGIEDAVC